MRNKVRKYVDMIKHNLLGKINDLFDGKNRDGKMSDIDFIREGTDRFASLWARTMVGFFIIISVLEVVM